LVMLGIGRWYTLNKVLVNASNLIAIICVSY
jgi:hypothetical protein